MCRTTSLVVPLSVYVGFHVRGGAAGARHVFEQVFHEYGLPTAIRTDNGVPFATTGIHGLSQLNVWWMRLGIQHQRILPAHPQQNGAHERMHNTLKAAAIRPPRATLAAQQRAFNVFRREFNDERPHAALHGRPPGSLYQASSRPFTGELPPIDYPGHFLVKRVTTGRWCAVTSVRRGPGHRDGRRGMIST